jgi:hypothetical protein
MTSQTIDSENAAFTPFGRFVPMAMAVAIVPGPVVSGMVSGKKERHPSNGLIARA